MMYTCPETDIHSVYLDGELPHNYIAAYESHVRSCPDCSAKLEQFRALKNAFQADKNAFHFSQNDLDVSFERLQIRLSYSKITQHHKSAVSFPKISGIKYFAAGIAAAAAVALILPGSGKSSAMQNQIASFQPVARTSISSVANQVKAEGNIDVSVLNEMLASESNEQQFYALPVSAEGTAAFVPMMVAGSPRYKKLHQKPPLASYDVFCPQEAHPEKNYSSFALKAFYPFDEIHDGIGK